MDDLDPAAVLVMLLFWFGFAAVVAVAANNKGRAGVGWFFLSLVISPLLAGLFVLAVKDLRAETVKIKEIADSKTCPRCAELVKYAATMCRFCGHEFPEEPNAILQPMFGPTSSILDVYYLASQGEWTLRTKLAELSRDQLNSIVAECQMDPDGHIPKWKRKDDVIGLIVDCAVKAIRSRAPS